MLVNTRVVNKSNKYELALGEFRGPLEKLLELIETRELLITELSLAEVTEDFLKYLETIQNASPRVLADFVSVAAKLLLIKSRAILPELPLTEEEEGDIAELEERLRLYQEFREAEKNIIEGWGKNVSYAREYLADYPKGFYLSQEVAPTDLEGRFARICEELETTFPKLETETVVLVSLEEKIEELISRVDKIMRTSFNDITSGRKQPEIIVFFLALLHLYKDSSVDIEQDGLFGEIKIVRNK